MKYRNGDEFQGWWRDGSLVDGSLQMSELLHFADLSACEESYVAQIKSIERQALLKSLFIPFAFEEVVRAEENRSSGLSTTDLHRLSSAGTFDVLRPQSITSAGDFMKAKQLDSGNIQKIANIMARVLTEMNCIFDVSQYVYRSLLYSVK